MNGRTNSNDWGWGDDDESASPPRPPTGVDGGLPLLPRPVAFGRKTATITSSASMATLRYLDKSSFREGGEEEGATRLEGRSHENSLTFMYFLFSSHYRPIRRMPHWPPSSTTTYLTRPTGATQIYAYICTCMCRKLPTLSRYTCIKNKPCGGHHIMPHVGTGRGSTGTCPLSWRATYLTYHRLSQQS